MSTALFFNLPMHGHVNPTLGVVAELVRRGEKVIYYGAPDFRQKIESTGAIFRDYGPLGHDFKELDPNNLIKPICDFLEFGFRIYPRLTAELADEKIDYIYFSPVCFFARAFAHQRNIPAICSIFTFAFNDKVSPIANPWEQFKLIAWGIPDFPRLQRLSKRYQEEYGIDMDLRTIYPPEIPLKMVYTSKEFQPHSQTFDSTYRFVGPSFYAPAQAVDFPLELLTPDLPVVYVSMGSVLTQQEQLYQVCIEALAEDKCRVVMAVGHKIDLATWKKLPSNFIVQASVPQLAILERAQLFITHCGMNSASEGIYYGVPQLMYPLVSEERLVARRVKEIGAGEILTRADITPSRLHDLVWKILKTPQYRQAAQSMGATLRAAGGPSQAVMEIMEFKKQQGIG